MGLQLTVPCIVADVSITYNVPGGDSVEATVTVPGLKVGDFVLAQRPADASTAQIANARVSAADTLKLTVFNWGGSTLSSTETLRLLAMRPERTQNVAEL